MHEITVFPGYWLWLEAISTIIIVLSCIVIYRRVNRLYQLSLYRGILYFQSSFLYFGTAFLLNFILVLIQTKAVTSTYFGIDFWTVLLVLFIYCISMGGFYLMYSLIWKNVECECVIEHKNLKIMLFHWPLYMLHIAALITAILVIIFDTSIVMFVTQLACLGYAAVLTFHKYKLYEIHNTKKNTFIQLYFIGLVLAILGFTINFIAEMMLGTVPILMTWAHILTTLVFLAALIGVYILTKNGKEKRTA